MSDFIDPAEPVLESNREEVLRKEAIERGAITYFTGNPCVWGHVAPRHTATGKCSQCRSMQTARRAEGEGRTFKPRGKQLKRNTQSSFGVAVGKSSKQHEWWLQGN